MIGLLVRVKNCDSGDEIYKILVDSVKKVRCASFSFRLINKHGRKLRRLRYAIGFGVCKNLYRLCFPSTSVREGQREKESALCLRRHTNVIMAQKENRYRSGDRVEFSRFFFNFLFFWIWAVCFEFDLFCLCERIAKCKRINNRVSDWRGKEWFFLILFKYTCVWFCAFFIVYPILRWLGLHSSQRLFTVYMDVGVYCSEFARVSRCGQTSYF